MVLDRWVWSYGAGGEVVWAGPRYRVGGLYVSSLCDGLRYAVESLLLLGLNPDCSSEHLHQVEGSRLTLDPDPSSLPDGLYSGGKFQALNPDFLPKCDNLWSAGEIL